VTEQSRKWARPLLASLEYPRYPVERGYTNRSLYVNLSDRVIRSKPVTEKMKEVFIGGRGFGLWLLWNAVSPKTRWNDPENEIVIASGPLGGITQYPGAGKSIVVTLSPTTGTVVDSNVGGHFGPLLKFSGWDALEIQGKAEKDVILYIDGNQGRVTIEEAPPGPVDSHLIIGQVMEIYAPAEEDRRSLSVVTTGSGAEHTLLGMLNFSFYDPQRGIVRVKQAGRGGTGTVFREKRIRALVVKYAGVKGDANGPADQKRINAAGLRMHREIAALDDQQCRMRRTGTTYLYQIMNDHDILPVHNFKFGSHPEAFRINDQHWKTRFSPGKADGCWYGCTLACSHVVLEHRLKTGPYKGQAVHVDGPEYETLAGVGSNCGIFDPEYVLECNFYCDTYGIDTISFGTTTAFAMECFENGIIDETITGGLRLNFGNAEAALELLHRMARGEGFGRVAGQGVRRMKQILAEKGGVDAAFLRDIGMEAKGLEYSEYVPKESLAQQGGYGLANKGPQHDEAWLIFMDMVLNQIPTFEDKAEALYYFPMFRTWFSLNGLCKLPWNDIVPADNADTAEPEKVPEHVENYVNIFSGVTGREITKEDIITMSAAVYNFQRIFNLKMGCGTREHDAVPYRSLGPVTVEEYESRAQRYDRQLKEIGFDPANRTTEEKIQALRRHREEQYQRLIDAVYARRGWAPNGVPTLETLRKLKIDFPEVVELVKKHLP